MLLSLSLPFLILNNEKLGPLSEVVNGILEHSCNYEEELFYDDLMRGTTPYLPLKDLVHHVSELLHLKVKCLNQLSVQCFRKFIPIFEVDGSLVVVS